MKKILIIDPSVTVSVFVKSLIKEKFNLEVVRTDNLQQTKQYCSKIDVKEIVLIISSVSHHDCEDFEVIDYVTQTHIPVIVFTSTIRQDIRDKINSRPVVDYILKSSMHNFDVLINLMQQLLHNENKSIMVIDDSANARKSIVKMLEPLKIDIIEEESAENALETLKLESTVKVVIVDNILVNMTGLNFTSEVRKIYPHEQLAIIGISSYNHQALNVEFLKRGANDFISKPAQKEELVHKILLNMSLLNKIDTITESNNRDFMTGIYNRKYAYETGRIIYENAKRGSLSMAVAMIDIDHFKKINDTYGHDVGDKVIIRLAHELVAHFRNSDIVARLGGEEFCVILSDIDRDYIEEILERLRASIENIEINFKDKNKVSQQLKFTVSIGATLDLNKSLDEMIKFADNKLYEAKNYGRNLVVI